MGRSENSMRSRQSRGGAISRRAGLDSRFKESQDLRAQVRRLGLGITAPGLSCAQSRLEGLSSAVLMGLYARIPDRVARRRAAGYNGAGPSGRDGKRSRWQMRRGAAGGVGGGESPATVLGGVAGGAME